MKKILLDNGFVLAKIAEKLGESPQNFQNMLNAADVKTGTLESICRAINENIYFFYSNKKYEDIVPRIEIPQVGEVVSIEKYEKKVEECALLRAELDAVKKQAALYAEKKEEYSTITFQKDN